MRNKTQKSKNIIQNTVSAAISTADFVSATTGITTNDKDIWINDYR
jgi:hypothetical protein